MDSTSLRQTGTERRRLGRYNLLQPLRVEASGTVYKAEMLGSSGFSRLVALKVYPSRRGIRAEDWQPLLQGAGRSGKLVHPNVLMTLDATLYGDSCLVATELISGTSLRQRLQRHQESGQPMTPELGLRLGTQLCRALQHAFLEASSDGAPLSLCHGALSPDHLYLDSQGTLKVGGFGTAWQEELMGLEDPLPTWLYRAPERRSGPVALESSADIYSVGVILLELLTLRPPPPFEQRLSSPAYQPGPSLDRLASMLPPTVRALDLAAVLARALSADPSRRYQSPLELLLDLESRLQLTPRRSGPVPVLAEGSLEVPPAQTLSPQPDLSEERVAIAGRRTPVVLPRPALPDQDFMNDLQGGPENGLTLRFQAAQGPLTLEDPEPLEPPRSLSQRLLERATGLIGILLVILAILALRFLPMATSPQTLPLSPPAPSRGAGIPRPPATP